ncbi:MAG TPA: class I SAM-dependent methyltransferase [Gemmataceae bacterium]|jgi:malonyl-CoA O-methyltransferase|nr:class I SAM-dependent methyltransferase [Gemmataceae bacterium]
MSIRDAYSDWSATYDTDRNRTRDLDAEVTRAALTGRRVRSVVEVGCGTGKNTALLAALAGRVLALDFSDGMLARARAKGFPPHVTFALADLTARWPVEAGTADLVVGNLVLEHIKDLRFVFAEVARSLAPGGRVYFSELHPFRQYQGTRATFARAGTVTEVAAHVHHVSDYLRAAEAAGLTLERFDEWWHSEDAGLPPRLATFGFRT